MKQILWTTIFWLALIAGFLGYMKWFDNAGFGVQLASYVIEMPKAAEAIECPVLVNTGDLGLSGEIVSNYPTNTDTLTNTKLDIIQQQLKDIAEKLDIQNSNTPDAVNISLKTNKKTNVRIFPFDGSNYIKYTLPASDDILRDTLNLLFDKTPFALVDTKLDTDGNLTITIARIPGTAFGGSAAVEQVTKSIEKTALQFTQIKKVIITPDTVLQP